MVLVSDGLTRAFQDVLALLSQQMEPKLHCDVSLFRFRRFHHFSPVRVKSIHTELAGRVQQVMDNVIVLLHTNNNKHLCVCVLMLEMADRYSRSFLSYESLIFRVGPVCLWVSDPQRDEFVQHELPHIHMQQTFRSEAVCS